MIESLKPFTLASLLLWTDRQVAAAFGMPLKRIQQLARDGELPALKLGRKWRFDPDAIRAWIKRSGAGNKLRCLTDTARVAQAHAETHKP